MINDPWKLLGRPNSITFYRAESRTKLLKMPDITGNDSVPIISVLIMAVLELPSHQQHRDDGDGVSPWNFGCLSPLDMDVCLRTFYWMINNYLSWWVQSPDYSIICEVLHVEVPVTCPILIIIIFIYCNWVVTQWQWLFYMYTKHEIGYHWI